MKFRQVAILFAGSFAFANAIAAQTATVSDDDAPVLAVAQPVLPPSELSGPQASPDPPLASPSPQSDAGGSAVTEDRYQAEIELLAQNRRQFVHCKLKNGKVLTGRVGDRGETTFAVRTNALGDGTLVEYKNLTEMPRAVPAVGTRIKQGAQMTGFVIFVVVFFIPLALTGVIPSC